MPIADWANVQNLSVPAAKVSADLTNFPIFIHLDDHHIFDVLTTDAKRFKIAVFDDADTEQTVQIGFFDAANRRGFLVFAHTVYTATDSEFFLCYDSGHGDNTAYIKDIGDTNAPWIADYKAAWLFSQDPTSTITEVASGSWNMTSTGSMTSGDLVDGDVDKAIDFDGSNDYLYSSTANLNINGVCTWTCMIKPGGALPGGRIMGKHKTGAYGWEIARNANSGIDVGMSPNGSSWYYGISGNNIVPDDVWTHVTVIWNGSSVRLYINGVLNNTGSFPFGFAASEIYGTGQIMEIGRCEQYPDTFGGLIQHASVSVIERANAWIEAEYLNLTGGLLEFGDLAGQTEISSTCSFQFVITGTPDGVSDYAVPCTDIQATRYDGGQTSITATVPDAAAHAAIFTARPNGELVANVIYTYSDGTSVLWEIVRTPFLQIIPSYGGMGSSLQVSGNKVETYTGGGTKTLPGVNFTSASPAGNISIRMNALMPRIRPGDTVNYKNTAGGDDSIVVKKISMSISADSQTFNMTE